MEKEINKDILKDLTPFERTVLMEIAKAQAFASCAYQVARADPDDDLPSPKDHLQTTLDAQMQGIFRSLEKNQSD